MDKLEMYEYTVQPEYMCRGLQIWHEETGRTRFKGFKAYSNFYKEEYLTIDGITYTSLVHAQDIKKVNDE